MQLIVDMNLTPRWVEFLIEAGIRATHWSAIGRGNATDYSIMAYSREHGFAVLTHDLDFGTILAVTNASKPSVVQLRATDVNPEAIGTKVVSTLLAMREELEAGVLLTVDTDRSRIRLLPIE